MFYIHVFILCTSDVSPLSTLNEPSCLLWGKRAQWFFNVERDLIRWIALSRPQRLYPAVNIKFPKPFIALTFFLFACLSVTLRWFTFFLWFPLFGWLHSACSWIALALNPYFIYIDVYIYLLLLQLNGASFLYTFSSCCFFYNHLRPHFGHTNWNLWNPPHTSCS